MLSCNPLQQGRVGDSEEMILMDKHGHLVSDYSIQELHWFAERIGAKRTWFHDRRIPHYDLKRVMVQRALVKGAVMVLSRDVVRKAVRLVM